MAAATPEEHSTGAAADDGDDDGRGECSDTSRRNAAPVTGHGSDDKTGVMSFFTAGVETVSDNGKTNAQQYFAHVRPFEGRVSGYYPSRTTLRGSQFAP